MILHMRRSLCVFLLVPLLCVSAARGQPGLDQRPANTTCLAPARPTGAAGVTVTDPFPAAPAFSEPVKLLQAPGNASRWFVLEKAGRIKTLPVANPATTSTWLDLTGVVDPTDEGGVLGMAFPPDYPATPQVYVYYTVSGSPLISVVSRFILDNVNAPVAPVEQVLLTVNQPYTNHKGGDIAFGPDGYLYIGLGDGGSAGDPEDHAQDNTDLLGAMLRIDVRGVPFSERYRIPADNPFAGNPRCGPGANGQACPEIYAWGLRNPWRWSFDRQTGELWLADVGQNLWEEVDLLERGGNYGWRCREGLHDYDTSGCPAGGFIEPIAEYGHSVGQSITGGFVYRGSAIPGLAGQYVFGDYSSSWVARLRDQGAGVFVREQLFAGYTPSAFGEGVDGELYLADYSGGRIYKLVASGGPPVNTIPTSLAATGCVNPANPTLPASGLIPYGINASFWSDGASKERWLALPDGTTITVDAAGDWTLPPGSVIMKNFRLGGQLVETRLLMRHPDGVWAGYTYEWNTAQTAATRVIGGKTRLVNGQSWIYPSENDCRQCHTGAAGFSLGLETGQLNRNFTYPSTGRTANELETLNHIGMFSAPLPAPALLPRLADPTDANAPVHARARAYLHVNCSQCHRPAGPTPVNIDLRNSTALQSMAACDVVPAEGSLGISGARIIAHGDAAHSVLAARDGRRDANGMPPLASNDIDTQGLALVAAWIDGLGSCNDADNDQADDARDNCTNAANTSQLDADADGYGNMCDADLNNSGLVTTADYTIMRSRLNTSDPVADLNGSGSVTVIDYTMLRNRLNTAPGPSGVTP